MNLGFRRNRILGDRYLTMKSQFTKSQIDRLGYRLRDEQLTEDDIKILDEYRRSFGPAYNTVIETVREKLNLESTGRPAKSTTSIIEKLKRESIRLTQIQDIAGCRIVLDDILEQDRIVESLTVLFPQTRIFDRRKNPSHGYRAVHVIPELRGKSIEIQVRTRLQHLWAELSEKIADSVGPAIKYGGGEQRIRLLLLGISDTILKFESFSKNNTNVDTELASLKNGIEDMLKDGINAFDKLRRLKT